MGLLNPLPHLRTLAHTRPTALCHRLRLLVTRHAAVRLPRLARRRLDGPQAVTRPCPPQPVLPPRQRFAAEGPAGWEAHFLGRAWSLELPIEWNLEAPQLDRMHLHYMEYLEALPAVAVEPLVLDWIRSNPPFARGSFGDAWNSYALSIRVLVWMQEAARGRLGLRGGVLSSLTAQLRFLSRNLELDLGGNHLLKNLKALLWGSRCFEGREADTWAATAERLLARELDEQILPDGMHFELSPAYHLQVFADLLECRTVLRPCALRDRLDASLEAMAQVAADLTHPDGAISLFSDGGLDMAYPPDQLLTTWQTQSARTVSPGAHVHLETAGYFGLREGGTLLLVDCGPVGPDHLPAHGHGDMLALEWTVEGRRILVDTGVFEYREGGLRRRSRSTAAHNTLTLDGQDQCEFWKSFRVGRRTRPALLDLAFGQGRFRLSGASYGYVHRAGAPVHVRTVEATPGSLTVEDTVRGGAGQRAEARLLLHPDCDLRLEDDRWMIRSGPLRILLATEASLRVEPAPWWPDFGTERATRQLVFDYGPAPCRGGFRLEVLP